MTLEEITNELRERVGAHSALSAIIVFDFSDDGAVRVNGTVSPTVVDNENADADCTVKISKENFLALAAGDLNPQMAFMMGKLRVEGDMSLALQLGEILG